MVPVWTTDWPGRDTRRVSETLAAGDRLRHRMTGWFALCRAERRFDRFAAHFDFLEPLLDEMAARLLDDAAAPVPGTTGATYDRCREVERGLAVVARLFAWYADKYEQRCDGRLGPVLAAADEVVRSCWAEPFAKVGAARPTGPLTFVTPQYGACATIRAAVPRTLKIDAAGIVRELVGMLPVPTVALPDTAAEGGWWLSLVAHEVGHHLEADLDPRLAERTAGVVDPSWSSWSSELFADVFAVLAVGEAAGWAVHELEYTAPAAFFATPVAGTAYPPPAIRLAVIGEAVRRLGTGTWPPAADEMGDWLRAAAADDPAIDTEPVAAHLARAAATVDALLDMRVGERRLGDLIDNRAGWFAPGGRIAEWSGALLKTSSLFPVGLSESARLAVLAGVRAYRTELARDADADALADLHRRLVDAVATAGPDGTLAGEDDLGAAAGPAARRCADRVLRFVRESS